MTDWQKVYEDNTSYRVEIVKAILEDHQLKPVIVNKKDAAYQFGTFEVHVASDQVLRALKIIKDEINFE
ncbi:MAG: DUF2007 domain-containing protein [Cyclobacteriaceae bacterium]|nr:DUF2007 domain-containing protein [Cyclobacteriaceae bacterium HetDA_MAG_MS6]